MRTISLGKRSQILRLRRRGWSIPDISKEIGIAKTTVQRHVCGVVVPIKFLEKLKEKQGGSKERARAMRANVASEVGTRLGRLDERDFFMLLLGIYWGEGTKRDFNIINSDARLIKTFIHCLLSMGVKKNKLSLSLRLHSDINIDSAKEFWSEVTGIPQSRISRIEIVKGKKKGKLPHGMCRVRVSSGIRERLFVQTAIQLVGETVPGG